MKLAVPYFKQFNKVACQPACIQMVAKYWGVNINQKQLLKKTFIGPGTSTALCAIELLKKGFTFIDFFNLESWESRQSKTEVRKYAQRHAKALEAGMIYDQKANVKRIKEYLNAGIPVLTEVCCNELNNDPKDKDYHLIVLVGFNGRKFCYHDPQRELGGTFKRITETKLKKSWGSLPLEVPNFYVFFPRIIITGTPCTGKTSVAEILGRKLKLPVTHCTELIKKKKLGTKRGGEIEINLVKLRSAIAKHGGIFESHLLCEFFLPNSLVFVLRCNPKILEKRMKKRKYSKQKIQENLECEALDYCTIKAEQNYGKAKVVDVDTTKKTPQQTVAKILKILNKKEKGDKVDFSGWLLSEL